jgi:hypothetical protein
MKPRNWQYRHHQAKQKELEIKMSELEKRLPNNTTKSKISKFFRSTLGTFLTFAALCGLSGIFMFRDELHKLFSSKHDLYEENNTITGEVQSPKISESITKEVTPTFIYNTYNYHYPLIRGLYIKDLHKMGDLGFKVGSNTLYLSVQDLYDGGSNFRERGYNKMLCDTSINLYFAAREDSLYVSTKFVSLKDEIEIGVMEYNHWRIYKDRYIDYRCSSNSLEDYR